MTDRPEHEHRRALALALVLVGCGAGKEADSSSAARALATARTPMSAAPAPPFRIFADPSSGSVVFGHGDATLQESELRLLEAVARDLREVSGEIVIIEVFGHADPSEPDGGELSSARANAVRTYLIHCGLIGPTIVARGAGPAAGRPGDQNRRAELRITFKGDDALPPPPP